MESLLKRYILMLSKWILVKNFTKLWCVENTIPSKSLAIVIISKHALRHVYI